MCDRRSLSPAAADCLGDMLTDLGDALRDGRVRVAAGTMGPAFTSRDVGGNGAQGEPATPFERGHGTPAVVATYGSQEREGTGVAARAGLDHPSPMTAPGCRLSGLPRRQGADAVAGAGGNGADPAVSSPAPGEADLRERIWELEQENRRLRTQLRWWQDAAAEPTTERGVIVRGNSVSGEVGRG